MSLIPVVNLPFLYINNLITSRASNTTLGVTAGQARDSTNVVDLVLSANTVLNTAVVGLNGLDTGTLAASTQYFIYIIGCSNNFAPTGVILSTSSSAPVLPFNYDVYRLIGFAFTDGSTNFISFTQVGNNNARTNYWDTAISALSAGTSNTYVDLSLVASVPTIDKLPVYLDVSFTPATAGDRVDLRPLGSSATQVTALSSVVASQAQRAQLKVLSRVGTVSAATVAGISYKNSATSGSTTIFVLGFDYFI